MSYKQIEDFVDRVLGGESSSDILRELTSTRNLGSLMARPMGMVNVNRHRNPARSVVCPICGHDLANNKCPQCGYEEK